MYAKDASKMIGTDISEGTYFFEKVILEVLPPVYLPLESSSGLSLRWCFGQIVLQESLRMNE